ncbi:MAG: hypothetical protein MMC23_009927 [Stictis urceolatum]|nr:hypothetical protein [Stictis urceolata]
MSSAHISSNVSSDLVWEITRFNNAFLVKRAAAGGVQLSRDPMNLTVSSFRSQFTVLL